jgi:hypothetical protein
MDLDNFRPSSDTDVQEFLDYVRYSEDAYLNTIPPAEHLKALTTCVEHLLLRVQSLQERLDYTP